jgi:ATP-dependent DNA ligase
MLPEGSDWTYEVKLDGYRAIGVKSSREAMLYSRNGKNFNKRSRRLLRPSGIYRLIPLSTARL